MNEGNLKKFYYENFLFATYKILCVPSISKKVYKSDYMDLQSINNFNFSKPLMSASYNICKKHDVRK